MNNFYHNPFYPLFSIIIFFIVIVPISIKVRTINLVYSVSNCFTYPLLLCFYLSSYILVYGIQKLAPSPFAIYLSVMIHFLWGLDIKTVSSYPSFSAKTLIYPALSLSLMAQLCQKGALIHWNFYWVNFYTNYLLSEKYFSPI